ncbi:hypothetical protein EK21DRAFT_116215 [Setomelanomma holmii]|uniref:Uncharacterized protein n=1 Tax=Setomelanomma holmii TaxID=210430 RepID=A0A9P4H2P1_9PLEO|nr:hypothetical protein EK21DRAFT_116215 [Setomelanomma holmii]
MSTPIRRLGPMGELPLLKDSRITKACNHKCDIRKQPIPPCCRGNADRVALEIHRKNLATSPFYKLSGEIRNIIYDLLADGEWHFQSFSDKCSDIKRRNALHNLAKVSRQLYQETRLNAYSTTALHVHHWGIFESWLSKRTAWQLSTLKRFHVHHTVLLNKQYWRNPSDPRLRFGKWPKTYWKNIGRDWPALPNLTSVVVHMHPFADPRGYTNPLNEPSFHSQSVRATIWDLRAFSAAEQFQKEMRYILGKEVNTTAVWDIPRFSLRLRKDAHAIGEDTVIGPNGYLQCNHADRKLLIFKKTCLVCDNRV